MKQDIEWSVKVRRRTGPMGPEIEKYGIIVRFEKPDQAEAAQALGEQLLDDNLKTYRVEEAACYDVVYFLAGDRTADVQEAL